MVHGLEVILDNLGQKGYKITPARKTVFSGERWNDGGPAISSLQVEVLVAWSELERVKVAGHCYVQIKNRSDRFGVERERKRPHRDRTKEFSPAATKRREISH